MESGQTIHFICVPYSGGSSFAYQRLVPYVPKNWKMTTLAFPGRGQRIREPLIYDLENLVQDSWQQLKDFSKEPYILFGHSLGATLAWLLVHKAMEEKSTLPVHLFLSGTDGPSNPPRLPYRYLLPKEDFKVKLKTYGGIPDEILNDEMAFAFFEPILRADFRAVETWKYTRKALLNIPATVITGTEEGIPEPNIRLWQKEFTSQIAFEKVDGNHFFLFENSQQFVDLLKRHLVNSLKMEKC
jgi:surfactin synthase thioesterase subunit